MSWRVVLYHLVRPLLFLLDPERIHRITIDALEVAGESPIGRALASFSSGAPKAPPDRWAEVAGLRLRSRVGIGAGWDKDGRALPGWAALGAGFVEVGTVTPMPQPGNPLPRIFRLPDDGALINRLGFNSIGALPVARRVMLARRHLPPGFVVGINIGRNRDTPLERVTDDYLAAHRLLAPVADYLVINVSSPNTPHLRDLQDPGALRGLVEALAVAGEQLHCVRPIFVKLAPDLEPEQRSAVMAMLLDAPAAGVVLSNSTLARTGLRSTPALVAEVGGLSGRPLLPGSLAIVAAARAQVGDRLAIIASGGIGTPDDAVALRDAGADLVQLWTGLVYAGPGLLGDTVRAVDGQRFAAGSG
ncbi:MAG TPA: quinone-dependent dihydroorotate dehydrogenase [Candidatus Limnocylindria bacterium]|nr:quinone-dependent dihydroorotate dehydrogenase [Candidatus Limnocylindria bacterium]